MPRPGRLGASPSSSLSPSCSLASHVLTPASRPSSLFSSRSEFKPIDYPAPDGTLSFDLLTNLSRSGTNHAEDQPVHLHIPAADRPAHVKKNVGEYAGLLGRVCPAGVYEYLDVAENGGEADADGYRLQINSQNCVHCKVRLLSRAVVAVAAGRTLELTALFSFSRPQTCSIKVRSPPLLFLSPSASPSSPAACASSAARPRRPRRRAREPNKPQPLFVPCIGHDDAPRPHCALGVPL